MPWCFSGNAAGQTSRVEHAAMRVLVAVCVRAHAHACLCGSGSTGSCCIGTSKSGGGGGSSSNGRPQLARFFGSPWVPSPFPCLFLLGSSRCSCTFPQPLPPVCSWPKLCFASLGARTRTLAVSLPPGAPPQTGIAVRCIRRLRGRLLSSFLRTSGYRCSAGWWLFLDCGARHFFGQGGLEGHAKANHTVHGNTRNTTHLGAVVS